MSSNDKNYWCHVTVPLDLSGLPPIKASLQHCNKEKKTRQVLVVGYSAQFLTSTQVSRHHKQGETGETRPKSTLRHRVSRHSMAPALCTEEKTKGGISIQINQRL